MTELFSGTTRLIDVDVDVYTCVFEKCYAPLSRFATLLINNEQEAKDIVADVMEKLLYIEEKFTAWKNIEAFLWIAVRNSCFNYLRHKEVMNNYKRNYLFLSREGYAIDEQDHYTERLVIIYKLIKALPCRCRQIFIMAYVEGWTRAEIADHLELTIDAVNSHLRNARNKIKGFIIKNVPDYAERIGQVLG